MRLERHKNFIIPDEIAALNAWVDEGVDKKWLDVGLNRGVMGYSNRVTSRFYSDRFIYPEIVNIVSARIRKFCGITEFGSIDGHGQDGIVVSCIFDGGDTYAHQDPRSKTGLATLRCNILTRAADAGGILHIEDSAVPLEVGELHCYLASEHEHYVSEVVGSTSRVLWMFGAHVPKEDWDTDVIKLEGTK